MTEMTPTRTTERVLCCCVLLDQREGINPQAREITCNLETSGPDDPFCSECSDRHVNHPAVAANYLGVTAKMRAREEA